MKYLYLDCFAGLDPSMILASFLDMGTDVKTLEKHFLSGVTIDVGNEKRMGMESVRVSFDSKCPSKLVGANEIDALINGMSVSSECEKLLKKYVSILKETCFFEPEKAEFDLFEQSVNLSALCALWNEIERLKIGKIYVSPIFTSSEEGLLGPFTKPETLCIAKKYALKTRYAKEFEEIFSPFSASVLASLGAESVSGFVPSSVIKIGYGAGRCELQTVPNILRSVIGEDFSDGLFFSEGELSLDFAETFDYAGMKER